LFISQINQHAHKCIFLIEMPEINSGLKGLRVIKTTQSGFEHFIHDEFATLPGLMQKKHMN
jgi:urate oxidase